MVRKQDKSLTIRVSSEWMETLDKWIVAQRLKPTRTQVIMAAVLEFIERSPNTQATSEPRQQPRASSADERALKAIRRGTLNAVEKRVGNNCPDCGANLNLVGSSHKCRGK